jgi:hypothetical protein
MVFLLGFTFLRGLKNLFFGSPNRQQTSGKSAHSQKHQQKHQQKVSKEKGKIIRQLMEDAEYVEYEEIKD